MEMVKMNKDKVIIMLGKIIFLEKDDILPLVKENSKYYFVKVAPEHSCLPLSFPKEFASKV